MKTRTITAIVLALICIPILIFSEYVVYPLFISLLAAVAIYEILKCLGLSKNIAISCPAYTFAAAMPLVSFFMGCGRIESTALIYFVISFIIMAYYFATAVFARGKISFSSISQALVFINYVVLSFTALTALRYVVAGVFTFILVFIGAWSTDTFAYLFGSKFGKHKLIPEISPKKSVEGSVAGIVCTLFVFALYGFILDLVTDLAVNYIVLLVLALFISVFSQIGDLIASLVKREHGIKDYGSIFPGHGGVLDRFDSILAVSTPVLLVALVFPPFS